MWAGAGAGAGACSLEHNVHRYAVRLCVSEGTARASAKRPILPSEVRDTHFECTMKHKVPMKSRV